MKKFIRFCSRKLWSCIRVSRLVRLLSDETFCRLQYFLWMGRRLRLSPPVDFNEKIQWLKINYRNPLLPLCVDKYDVRGFVAERIGEEYLNSIIGVYDRVEDIDWGKMPNRFVLKATHGSGWNLICKDKSSFDISHANKTMRRWLKRDFSLNGREWQYHEIKPRIICETYLEDGSAEGLMDYKMFTFNGVCKYIWVDYYKTDAGKGLKQHLRNIYDENWIFQPNKRHLFPNGKGDDVAKPKCLKEMISLASKLSVDFPLCRVDFYVLDNKKPIFGELTFSPANGCNEFYPQSFCDELGGYINLPK